MTMYRRILAAVGVVLVVAAVGGFFLLKGSAVGPSTWADRARVTGYPATGTSGHPSGAVSVELDGAAAARIDMIVEGLPRANLRYIGRQKAAARRRDRDSLGNLRARRRPVVPRGVETRDSYGPSYCPGSPRKSVSARWYGAMVVVSAYSSGPCSPSPSMPKITASMPRW